MDIRLIAPTMTFIGICVSIFLWRLNQRKKELSYSILWRRPLLNLKGIAREQMDILFKGRKVSDADLLVIRIFNSGHLPINTSDYQTNLAIELEPGASIIDVNVIETVPANLEERIKIKTEASTETKQSSNETTAASTTTSAPVPNSPLIEAIAPSRIAMHPILLNDGDSMTIQMLVLNAHGRVGVTGHVNGIANVRAWKESRVIPALLTQIGVLIMASATLFVDPDDLVALALDHVLPYMLAFLLGYVCFSAGLYWPRKDVRKFA